MEKQQLELIIKSCGIGAKGNTVVRAFGPDMTEYIIPTDHVTFAQLAAAGVRILNERHK